MVYSFSQQIFIEASQRVPGAGDTCGHTRSLPSQGSHSKGGDRQSTGEQSTGEKEVSLGMRAPLRLELGSGLGSWGPWRRSAAGVGGCRKTGDSGDKGEEWRAVLRAQQGALLATEWT